MGLYKCKDCTHEEDYERLPSECIICGGSTLVLLESEEGEIAEVDRDVLPSPFQKVKEHVNANTLQKSRKICVVNLRVLNDDIWTYLD